MKRDVLLRLHAQRNPLAPDCTLWPIQLGMRGDPWRVMVACYLLNQTSGRQARPVLSSLLARWPSPLAMLSAGVRPEEVRPVVEGLGFGTVRAASLCILAKDFLTGAWGEAGDLITCGAYCRDALRIFCFGDYGFEPADAVLADFVGRLR